MSSRCIESTVEEAVLEWSERLRYALPNGPEMAASELAAERETFGDVVLVSQLQDAIARINPNIPDIRRTNNCKLRRPF